MVINLKPKLNRRQIISSSKVIKIQFEEKFTKNTKI